MTEFILNNSHSPEIDIERLPLSFFISTPSDIDKVTIPIVVLHGFGDYANSIYMQSLHKSLTSNYNVAIITVNYIGTFSKVFYTNSDSDKLYEFLNYTFDLTPGDNKKTFLQILYALSSNNNEIIKYLHSKNCTICTDFTPYKRMIDLLIYKIENNLCNGHYVIERLYEMGFTNAITSFDYQLKNDYQDFGPVQAIDVLTAIAHLRNHQKYKDLNWKKLAIVGTSHGAYVSSMCDKIAPNTFQTIVNNSGWIKSISSELFSNSSTMTYSSILTYSTNTLPLWSPEPNNPNSFSLRHQQIRDLTNSTHIQEQINQTYHKNNKRYYFSHTINDSIVPLEDKDNYISLIKNYFKHTEYLRLDDTSKLNMQTFKSLEHGASASLKGLVIDYVIKKENNSLVTTDFTMNNKILYSCENGYYIINFSKNYPSLVFINY